MIRAVLALLQRALREETRQITPWLVRAGLALFAALLVLPVGNSGEVSSGAAGLELLRIVAAGSLGFLVLFGAPAFATSITEEKEEEALPLLRLTDLTPLSLLLGKSASRLLAALVLLLAPFPLMMALMPLGGVAMGQVVATYTCLFSFAILLNGVGTLASVILTKSSHAILATWLVTVALGGGCLLVMTKNPPATGASWLLLMSPAVRLQEALAMNFSGSHISAGDWANILLGLTLFIMAWLVFDIANKPGGSKGDPERAVVLDPDTPEPPPHRSPVLDNAPVFWKDREILFGGRDRMLHALPLWAAIVLFLTILLEYGFRPNIDHGLALCFAALVGGVIGAAAQMAGGVVALFQTEIQEKTLGPLVMANLTVGRIVREKTRALLFLLRVPFCCGGLGLLGVLLYPTLTGEQKALVFNATFLALSALFLFSVLCVFFTSQLRWAPAVLAFGSLLGIQLVAVLSAMPAFASGLNLALLAMGFVNVVAGVFFFHLTRDRLRYLVTME
jgi:hypothetical protein